MDLAREPRFRLGSIEVRPSTRELVFDGKREVLEPRVMAVLITLSRAKGEVVTREDLTEACWDGRIVSDDAINRVISRIRRAVDLTSGRDFTLETITKVGYRLVAQPATEGAPPPKADAAPLSKPWWRRALLVELIVLVAMVAGMAVWLLAPREPDWNPDPRASLTLAVLPFDNLGPEAGDLPLAIGMAREIRNTLSRVRGLRVVSDASSFAIASEKLPAEQMGKRLHTDYLVDGSLARTGDTVKLTVELVDAWSGVNLWTGSQAGPAANLDKLRQEVSASVFEQLVKRIGPDRLELLAPPRPSSPQVYKLLVEAQDALGYAESPRIRGPEDELNAGDRASELVEQALAIEPESPQALTLKAQIVAKRMGRAEMARTLSERDRQAEAAVYLRRAIASDPDTSAALAALGEYYRRFEWRWDDARALLTRAVALDPNNAQAHTSYSYFLSGVGNCVDALKHARSAVEIDPEFNWRTLSVPRALKCLGRFAETDKAYLSVLDHGPGNVFVLREMVVNYLMRGDAEAIDSLRAHVRDVLWKGSPEKDVQEWLDWSQAAADALRGNKAKLLTLVEQDVRDTDGPSESMPMMTDFARAQGDTMWLQAVQFAVAGAPDRAVDLLQASLAVGRLYIPETMPYGAFEFTPEVRANPRYQALWRTDPRLIELARLRLEALRSGKMMGVLPDGQAVMPESAD